MLRPAEPVMIPARCQQTQQGFRIGVRPVAGSSAWQLECAIPIREEWIIVQPSQNQQLIQGALHSSETYLGCPRCRAMSLVKCGACNKFNCHDMQQSRFTCAWCKNSGTIGGEIESFSGNAAGNT